MRSRLPYVFSLLLLWICSPSTVAAQSLERTPHSIQPLPQKTLSDTKPVAAEKASEQSEQILLLGLEGKPKILVLPAKSVVMSNVKPFEDTPDSAHILIWQAPPDLDQDMILEIPKDFSSNMPIIKGLPPFSGDFRGVLINQPRFANPFFAPDTRKQPK